jgi:hypothetical protein
LRSYNICEGRAAKWKKAGVGLAVGVAAVATGG